MSLASDVVNRGDSSHTEGERLMAQLVMAVEALGADVRRIKETSELIGGELEKLNELVRHIR